MFNSNYLAPFLTNFISKILQLKIQVRVTKGHRKPAYSFLLAFYVSKMHRFNF